MSTSLAFVISLMLVLALSGVALFNYKKGRMSLFRSSLFVLFMYAVGHLVNTLWLAPLGGMELVKIHYLYFAFMQLTLSIGLVLLNRNSLTTMMSITIFLLMIETLLGFAVHIDRNIVALNGNLGANLYDSRSWFLWDLRNIIAQISSVTVIIAVSLHKVFRVETRDPIEAFALVEKVEDELEEMLPPSALKDEALDMLNNAAQMLVYHDGLEFKPKTLTGVKLLQEAVEMTRYEPQINNQSTVKKALYWLRS